MPATALNTSTLSEALDKEKVEFAVGSTTNISVGQLLVIQGTAGIEAVKVQEIPVSGRVKVKRGVAGTKALAHKNGARFFIGAHDAFQNVRDGVIAGIGGSNGDFADYLFPGARYRDGIGNEYVLVELTATCYGGTTVLISSDGNFTARPLVGGDQGAVGLIVDPGTSDQYVWAQTYGYNSYAQESAGSSGATSADLAVAATSVSTPDVGLVAYAITSTSADRYRIYNMFIVGAATTATTSATSATGVAVPVFLNYPYVQPLRETITTS